MSNTLIEKYFPRLDADKKAQFAALDELYREWNERINVISRKDIDNLYERHILHSLAVARVIAFKPGTLLLDAGTGGGFPGIPLAILFPQADFHLVDSIAKKLKVVEAISSELGLNNVKISHSRMEKLSGTYDFVLGRAISALPKFISFTRKLIHKNGFNELENGILYLKGGDVEEEFAGSVKEYKIFMLKDFYEEAFFETKKLIHIPIN